MSRLTVIAILVIVVNAVIVIALSAPRSDEEQVTDSDVLGAIQDAAEQDPNDYIGGALGN